jgi:hypothetical protein
MDNNWATKGMFDARTEGKREIGRPKVRWGIVWTGTSDV